MVLEGNCEGFLLGFLETLSLNGNNSGFLELWSDDPKLKFKHTTFYFNNKHLVGMASLYSQAEELKKELAKLYNLREAYEEFNEKEINVEEKIKELENIKRNDYFEYHPSNGKKITGDLMYPLKETIVVDIINTLEGRQESKETNLEFNLEKTFSQIEGKA